MIWHNLLFSTTGFLASLILFVDHNLSNVCFTRGCDIIRRSKHAKIFGFSNTIFGITGFGALIFSFIWFPDNFLIGPIIIAGTVYAIYFTYLGIRRYQAQCPFCIVANISMFMLFLIWLSEKFQ